MKNRESLTGDVRKEMRADAYWSLLSIMEEICGHYPLAVYIKTDFFPFSGRLRFFFSLKLLLKL